MIMGFLGQIAGISGITGAIVSGQTKREGGWQVAFILGMCLSIAIVKLTGQMPDFASPASTSMLIFGGLCVGAGTYLGNGCTSGHGVCGLARLSPRSIAATLTFLATTALTVFILRHGLGG